MLLCSKKNQSVNQIKAKPGLGHSAVGWELRAMVGALPGGKVGACWNNAVQE